MNHQVSKGSHAGWFGYLASQKQDSDCAIIALDIDPEPPYNFVCGTSDSDVWEVDGDPSVLVEGQSGDVCGLAAHPMLPHIYASGSADGTIYIWDAEQRLCLHSLPVHRMDEHMDEESDPAARTGDGYAKGERLKVQAIDWSANGDMLAIACCGVVAPSDDPYAENDDQGGVVQLLAVEPETWFPKNVDHIQDPSYDPRKFVEDYYVWETKDCNDSLEDVKISPDGFSVAAGCHDSVIYLYNRNPKFQGMAPLEYARARKKEKSGDTWRRAKAGLKQRAKTFRWFQEWCTSVEECVGHSSYITHIDWNLDSTVLQSNSGDYEILYWDARPLAKDAKIVNGQKRVPRISDHRIGQLGTPTRDMAWKTWTCTLGFPVMGIWQDGECGNDINACHRSPDGHFLVSSGDDGLVRLFNYPAVIKEAPNHAFKGHSAFAENVRFLCDSNRVVSVGGGDRCLIQWKTYGVTSHIPDKTRINAPTHFKGSQRQIRAAMEKSAEQTNLEQDVEENYARIRQVKKSPSLSGLWI
jgi:WD40 repeat protein